MLHAAEQYAADVQSGAQVAGQLVRKVVARHLADLAQSEADPTYPYELDRKRADIAVRFFALLRHSKGEWAGQRFELQPWQAFIVWSVFGWVRRVDGLRRYRTVYIEVARKNGKSTWLAGVGTYLLVADGEPGAEVYTAATKFDQAKIIFSEAERMVSKSPALAKRVRNPVNNLHVPATASKFQPLGADSKTLDGLNVHGGLVDELHEAKNSDLWDVLDTATGARRQPLMIAITTAGSDTASFCYEQRDYGARVLDGVITDETYFPYIASIDEGDAWSDPSVWIKANPNLGVSVYEEGLRDACTQALNSPRKQNNFRRKRVNEWTQARTRYLDLAAWDACAGELMPYELEKALHGRRCYGGLDLSSNTDLTALALLFPPEEPGGVFDCVFRAWLPEKGPGGEDLEERARVAGVPYPLWAEGARPFLEITDGNVVDYTAIEAEIGELAELYEIAELAFDRWGSQQIATNLQDAGLVMVQFGQGVKSMNEPTLELERLVLSQRLRHAAHPVARWAANNLEVRTGGGGLLKPHKPEHHMSHKKIDPMVALVMAIGRGAIGATVPTESVYESRGITVV